MIIERKISEWVDVAPMARALVKLYPDHADHVCVRIHAQGDVPCDFIAECECGTVLTVTYKQLQQLGK